MVLDNNTVFGTVNANRTALQMATRRCSGPTRLGSTADHAPRAGRAMDAIARTAARRHQSHRRFFLSAHGRPHRRLCDDRRLQDRRAGVPRRLNRLVLLATFRFRRLLCRAARHARARPLVDCAARRRQITRRYRPNTLVLETHFETEDGAATLIDFMPLGSRHSTIVRLSFGARGKVTMRTELILRFGYGAIVPWVTRLEDGALRAIAGPDMVGAAHARACTRRGYDDGRRVHHQQRRHHSIRSVLSAVAPAIACPDRSDGGDAGYREILA